MPGPSRMSVPELLRWMRMGVCRCGLMVMGLAGADSRCAFLANATRDSSIQNVGEAL